MREREELIDLLLLYHAVANELTPKVIQARRPPNERQKSVCVIVELRVLATRSYVMSAAGHAARRV
jgi:hypothetical protein